MNTTKFADLADILIAEYKNNTAENNKYPGTWMNDAVYSQDYATLGEILGEILFLNEDGVATATPLGLLDSNNAFEEFFYAVLEKTFSMYGVIPIGDAEGEIDISILEKLIDLVERQENDTSVYGERDELCLEKYDA
jgi:hypothetical protein